MSPCFTSLRGQISGRAHFRNICSSCEKQACQLMQVLLLNQLWLQAGLSTVPNYAHIWVTLVVVIVGCNVQAPEGHGNKG